MSIAKGQLHKAEPPEGQHLSSKLYRPSGALYQRCSILL